MVSTRQMAVTTTSGSADDSVAPMQSTNARISALNGVTSTSIGKQIAVQSTLLQTNTFSQTAQIPFGSLATANVQTIYLLDLPVEILDKIFSYVGYKKVGQLRAISHQMNLVCSTILNSTFQKLQTQLLNRFQSVKAKMPRRESARRNHPLACECDVIETCYMRLSLLQMTFGKHIERKHCCFFPGGILDEVYNVINYIRITPKLARPYKVTDELFDLSTMAMEYFKEHIEPNLPEIAYFSKDFLDFTSNNKQNYMETTSSSSLENSHTNSLPSPPHMVLRKGIRKIKQGMKKYNNQLSVLRNELRTCKRKATEQAKQIAEQQKLLAEQQKQALDYANRLDENDKKNEEMSRKFSTLLQELNKCKTELQYWRSKSPATPICNLCGQVFALPTEEIQVLVNQGVKPEDMGLMDMNVEEEDDDDAINARKNCSNEATIEPSSNNIQHVTDAINSPHNVNDNINISIGSPKSIGSKRKHEDTAAATSAIAVLNHSGNDVESKKLRRVQNKNRSQGININKNKNK